MSREMIEIEAVGDGWLVRSGEALQVFETKFQAIERAQALAARRYVQTGCATGVRVPVAGSAPVIVGICG